MSKRPLPMSAIFDPKRHVFPRPDAPTETHETHDDELEALRAFVAAFDAWDEHFHLYERWKAMMGARADIPEGGSH